MLPERGDGSLPYIISPSFSINLLPIIIIIIIITIIIIIIIIIIRDVSRFSNYGVLWTPSGKIWGSIAKFN